MFDIICRVFLIFAFSTIVDNQILDTSRFGIYALLRSQQLVLIGI